MKFVDVDENAIDGQSSYGEWMKNPSNGRIFVDMDGNAIDGRSSYGEWMKNP